MTNSAKIALAAVTVYPIVYMIAFMAIVILTVASGPGDGGGLFNFLPILMIFHFLTILVMFGLLAFYIVHVLRREDLKPEMKILWAVVVFMGGPIGMCVYWYMNIWTNLAGPKPPTGQLGQPDTASWVRPEQSRAGEYAPPSEPPDWR